jgi:N-glycosylase/DNA lyase
MIQGVKLLPEPFSLGLTLLCGQCFRWDGPDADGWFTGVAGQAFWRLKQEGNRLFWECNSPVVRNKNAEDWLSFYLSFDEDLNEWAESFESHSVMQFPLKVLSGLRLIRQESWECTISYMFAQGLSVKVIRHALKNFCTRYGRPLEDIKDIHAFPEAGDIVLLSPDSLRPFTNNYRARADRIIRMSRAVEAKVVSLDHLKSIPCDDAREALMSFDGIGPKIADCILLFSMDHQTAFPVDRWVLRAMKRYFRSIKLLGGGEEAPTRAQYVKIVQKARTVFGDHCGVASEYLFLFLRMLEDVKLREELSPYCLTLDPFLKLEKLKKSTGVLRKNQGLPSRKPL